MFTMLSQGKDEIDIATANTFIRGRLEEMAKKYNITSGKISRDVYMRASEDRRKEMEANGGRPPMGGPTPSAPGTPQPQPGTPAPPGSSGSPGSSDKDKEERIKRFADEYFQRQDANKDGVLDQNEMSSKLKERSKEFDKNNDGKIDRAEAASYISGWADRSSRGGDNNSSNSRSNVNSVTIRDVAPERPMVYRPGNLPQGLPDWFVSLDVIDVDGQIGLYEWRKGDRPLDEFNRMDLNQDGFLTPDELLRYNQLVQNGQLSEPSVASEVTGSDGYTDGGTPRPSFGGARPGGFGGFGGRPGFGNSGGFGGFGGRPGSGDQGKSGGDSSRFRRGR